MRKNTYIKSMLKIVILWILDFLYIGFKPVFLHWFELKERCFDRLRSGVIGSVKAPSKGPIPREFRGLFSAI